MLSRANFENVVIDLICLFLLLFSHINIVNKRRYHFPLVGGFILANVAAVTFEIISTVLKIYSGNNNIILLFILENGYNCSSLIATSCWFLNSIQVTNKKLFSRRGLLCLLMLPMFVLLGLTLSSGLHHKIFYFSQSYQYVRGEWFVPFFACAGIYLLVALYFYIRAELNKEIYVFRNLNMISAIYTLILVFFMIIQIETKGVMSLINVACAIISLLIHEDFQKKEITFDYLTDLHNRNALNEKLSRMLKSAKDNSYVVMLDVDLFKQINDKYGHLEGDKALIGVGRTMDKLFGDKAFYGRLGGDEFLILFENADETEVASVEDKMNNYIREVFEKEKKNYIFTISAGWTKITDDLQTIPEILEIADERLYNRKRDKKSKINSN